MASGESSIASREGDAPEQAPETTKLKESAHSAETEYNAKGSWVLGGAHFAHDLYIAFIGVLIPAVQAKLGISLTLVSLMVPAQQFPSVLQPFIGAYADRTSRRWFVVLTPGVAGIAISLIGMAPNFVAVLGLLLISGLASAAFHAPAVALVGDFGGPRLGFAMALFNAGGKLSRTVGPLIIAAAISWFTLEGSAVVMVFGILASIILYLTIDTTESDARSRAVKREPILPLLRRRKRPLIGLLGYSVLNQISSVPFQYFLVAMLVAKGHSQWYGGFALSVLFGSSIAGGFLGGMLSDRIGRKPTVVVLALTTVPFYYLYLYLENGSLWVLGILAIVGLVAMSTRTVSLAQAQELFPEARGTISGILLAIGFIMLSVAAFGFGALSDWIGIETAFYIVAISPLLALPFLKLVPNPGDPLE